MAETACKKLINNPEDCVDEALEGCVLANSGLRLLKGHRVLIREDVKTLKKEGKVTLLSGGGSGHEPAHGGFVGKGMLTTVVAGSVFASPPTSSILSAVRAVAYENPAGVLLIVKNYTGDRLNFGIAAEHAKAEGIKVDMVIVGEDCALSDSLKSTAGRRGLCGTILIHKIAGALSEMGHTLEEITEIASAAVKDMGTMSVSLSPCSIPGKGPSFTLKSDEMELGLGIHGEPGVKRTKVESADAVVKQMIDHMTCSEPHFGKVLLKKGDCVALVVNNLGGTSHLELNIMARAAIKYLVNDKGVNVDRVYVGALMTSLEMAGVSLTLMHLNEVRKQCLDYEVSAPGWPSPFLSPVSEFLRTDVEFMEPIKTSYLREKVTVKEAEQLTPDGELLYEAVNGAVTAFIENEAKLNELDRQSGDGDCGSTLKFAANAVRNALGSKDKCNIPCNTPHNALLALSQLAETVGGTSGVFYSLFLAAAAIPLKHDTSLTAWMDALDAGITAIMKYGGAEAGQRTMLDALIPALDCVKGNLVSGVSGVELLRLAFQAAQKGAEATRTMEAKAGRASYITSTTLTDPDPGAMAVALCLGGIYNGLKK